MSSNSDNQNPSSIALRIFLVALALMIALTMLLMSVSDTGNWPTVAVIFAIAVIALLGVSLSFISARITRPKDKSKRELAGLDLYSVIDRLVADLDDDEAAYLQKRLDERDAKAKNELTATLGDLLDQRSDVRRSKDE